MERKSIKHLVLGLLLLSSVGLHAEEESYWQKFKNSLNDAKEWVSEKWQNLTGKKEETKQEKFECPKTEGSPVAEAATASPQAHETAMPEKK